MPIRDRAAAGASGCHEAARERLIEEGGPGPTHQDVAVLIIYFYQGEAVLDVDNIAKSLLDGLRGVLFRDDRQVSELLVRKSRLSAGLSLTERAYIYWKR